MFVHELHSSQHTKVQLIKGFLIMYTKKRNQIYTLLHEFLCGTITP